MNVCAFHDEMKETIKDHGRRIASLETRDAEFAIRIDNLCEKLDSLTSWIKALVITVGGAVVGFFFWYIQSLPRG